MYYSGATKNLNLNASNLLFRLVVYHHNATPNPINILILCFFMENIKKNTRRVCNAAPRESSIILFHYYLAIFIFMCKAKQKNIVYYYWLYTEREKEREKKVNTIISSFYSIASVLREILSGTHISRPTRIQPIQHVGKCYTISTAMCCSLVVYIAE